MRPTTNLAADGIDELANGQTIQAAPRANRVPRIPAPRPSLYRRLLTAIKRLWLEWLLYDLGNQLDEVEATLAELGAEAQAAANRFRRTPALHSARRRDARRLHASIATRMLAVRRELDNLQGAL